VSSILPPPTGCLFPNLQTLAKILEGMVNPAPADGDRIDKGRGGARQGEDAHIMGGG
jgi:hypothetical protein